MVKKYQLSIVHRPININKCAKIRSGKEFSDSMKTSSKMSNFSFIICVVYKSVGKQGHVHEIFRPTMYKLL